MSSNLQKLGLTLTDRMAKTANGAVPTTLELGKINSNLSLTTDSLKGSIPRGDYMIALHLTGSSYKTSSETTQDGSKHSHDLPSVFRSLKAGDRVLVAWCGHEPVVISVVVGG